MRPHLHIKMYNETGVSLIRYEWPFLAVLRHPGACRDAGKAVRFEMDSGLRRNDGLWPVPVILEHGGIRYQPRKSHQEPEARMERSLR